MDRLPKMYGQKIIEATVGFSMWKTDSNDGKISSNRRTKNLLKQRLDFQFEKEIHTMDRCLKSSSKKVLKQRLDFPFENKIETMGRLAKMHGQEIVETTFGFSIWIRYWSYG